MCIENTCEGVIRHKGNVELDVIDFSEQKKCMIDAFHAKDDDQIVTIDDVDITNGK